MTVILTRVAHQALSVKQSPSRGLYFVMRGWKRPLGHRLAMRRDQAGLKRVGELFIKRGVENVIITLGGRGVYFVNQTGKSALLPATKTTVVDTTAAGDTFVGSYALAAVAAGDGEFDIETAVAVANRAAAKTVADRKSVV